MTGGENATGNVSFLIDEQRIARLPAIPAPGPRVVKDSPDSTDGPARRPGIKAVAERAGVGIATVSRVLAGKPGTSAALVERVQAAARELGYVPNVVAQGLRQRCTRTVGVLVPPLADPVVAALVDGAAGVLADAGFSLQLAVGGAGGVDDARRLDLLRQRQVDGLLAWPGHEDEVATLAALRSLAEDAVVVALDRRLPANLRTHAVLWDHAGGAADATRALLEAGHRRLAVLVGGDTRPARERLRAIHEACEARGAFEDLLVRRGVTSAADAAMAIESLMAAPQSPTALIVDDGGAALEGALMAIRRRGLIVGVDLSLVAGDEGPLCRVNDPPIAAIARDPAQLGRRAAELLLHRIEGPGPPETALLPTRFEARASVGPVPIGRK
jgi:LacI family transcriptional regulator